VPCEKVVRLARYGLGVMRRPASAALALSSSTRWTCQLFAVYTADARVRHPRGAPGRRPRSRADERATIFPLWPGNVGLVQAAVALPAVHLLRVDKARGIAFGFGLQAIEASVGSASASSSSRAKAFPVAMLRVMPDAAQAETPEKEPVADAERPRLACPASLKGVLSARAAAAALAEGLRSWAEVDELPVADGGEGTLDVLYPALRR